MQINLQHSKVATNNLTNLIQQDHTDIVYVLQNKTAGITRTRKTKLASVSHYNYQRKYRRSTY